MPKKQLGSPQNQEESHYSEEYDKYRQVFDLTLEISVMQHGIETTGRGVRAVRIFTRQTLLSISLLNILPSLDNDILDNWDICSIASLARNIVDGYLAIFYSGTEKVSNEEAELRFFLGQFHRNREWYAIRKLVNSEDEELKDFEKTIEKQKVKIKNHIFLDRLSAAQRNRALRGDEMYLTKGDFEKRCKACSGLQYEYRLLSNFVHPLPISIERVNNNQGRGDKNTNDLLYITLCLIIARKYLAASTLEIIDFFPSKFEKDFKLKADRIRPFVSKNWNNSLD